MSFIYEDENLVSQLLKLAQAAPATPAAPAAPVPAAAAPPSPETNKYFDIARQLVKNLQTEVAGGTVITSERDNADLSQAHLVTLRDLLWFLYYNGIKVNGKSLVFRAQNFDLKKLGEDAKLYVPFPALGERQYYVYRDGLLSYLNDLKNKSTDNPMLTAAVNKMLGNINNELPAAPGSKDKPAPGQPGQPGQNQPGAQQAQALASAISQAISTLPFNIRDINFNRIKTFFDVIKPIMSQNTAALSHMNNVESVLIPQAFSFLAVKDGIIPLGERVHQFASRLSDQQTPGKQVFPLISALDRIMDETRAVIEAFWYAHKDKLNSGQQAQILGQIGRNPDDSSIYNRNTDALETLRTSGTVT